MGIPALNTSPLPFKIIQLPELMVILYENNTDFRQIFLDGREHPIRSTADLDGILNWQVGARHARRRHEGIYRPELA